MSGDSPPVARADLSPRGWWMRARVVRFPVRRMRGVWVGRARGGGWLVIARGHAWLHGDRKRALADARWLANNLRFPIRDAGDSA
jgi:hypothetical protein